MVKLKPDVVAEYRRSGYLLPTSNAPLRALSSEQAALARRQLETVESATGKPANSVLVNGHISHQWIHDIVTSPTILDAVEDLIGPDILVWAAQVSPAGHALPRTRIRWGVCCSLLLDQDRVLAYGFGICLLTSGVCRARTVLGQRAWVWIVRWMAPRRKLLGS